MPRKKLRKRNSVSVGLYIAVLVVGLVMLLPIVWMFFATFKSNEEIFGSLRLFPEHWSLQPYIDGWNVNGRITYATFYINTFVLTLVTTLITVFIAALVAYGFARFKFPMKKLLFTILISTLMLPNAVLMIPRYSIFNSLGMLDSYMPFYMQALLGCYPFFIFMLIQFLRGIPRDLDESAYIDGCSEIGVLTRILLPLLKPALFSAALFQFMWTYNDYTNVLIYINSVKKYTLSLALRLSLDSESVVQWNKVMAMSFLSMVPLGILFFAAQKYFVEGMMTGAIKG
ncbi:MAG: carbohydrate ABC transporter permease [Oscillospiraceae bacterium]|nr:carbohydrate ABC transporter permease [Oscillospiraceae bacterium]